RLAATEHCLLEGGIFVRKARNLIFKCGSLVRHRGASPTALRAHAQGHRTGAAVEPQEPLGYLVEGETLVVRIGCLGECRHRASDEGHGDECRPHGVKSLLRPQSVMS